jgi:hypothetical protein
MVAEFVRPATVPYLVGVDEFVKGEGLPSYHFAALLSCGSLPFTNEEIMR